MKNTLIKKLYESFLSVVPITLLVVIINLIIKTENKMDSLTLVSFLFGAFFIVLGIALYTLGVDTAMTPIGSHLGSKITKTRKLWFILLMSFIIGIIITIAEPDLTVLESQAGIKGLKYIIAVGIGLFMIISVLRIVFRINLKILLLILYSVVFFIVVFSKENIIPLAFDSGGVTTGPITVPFIIALSVGITGVLGGKGQSDNEFGTIGICSVGPILTVLVVSIFMNISPINEEVEIIKYSSFSGVLQSFFGSIPKYLLEVIFALLPIVVLFLIFQIFSLKLTKIPFMKIITGIIYSIIGLTLFFTGVNVGFINAGKITGMVLASYNKWSIIPFGVLIGCFIIFAEPAVHVLCKQVESETNGVIKKSTMMITLAISMAIAVGLSMLRIVINLDFIYLIAPGYLLALLLMIFSPNNFTGIAFDSGGVASGPMTATFLLPFASGACYFLEGSSQNETFGLVALVALLPLISIQIIGIVFKLKAYIDKIKVGRYFKGLLKKEGQIIDLSHYVNK